MPTLDWHLRRKDGITLVELLVRSERNCEIRVESELQPVWPPRRQGVPAAGWEDGTFVEKLQAGERLVLGYASPAEPVEPPAKLQVVSETDSASLSPQELIHALGDPKPPRDAVPVVNSASTALVSESSSARPQQTGNTDRTVTDRTATLLPLFDSWFEAVESRLAEATQLETRETLPNGLRNQLDADRRQLERIRTRQQELTSRFDGLDFKEGDNEPL